MLMIIKTCVFTRICRNILATTPVNTSVLELQASDGDLKGDLTFELIGSYPGTEYMGIQETGPQIGNSQSLSIYVKRPLSGDDLISTRLLVSSVRL